MIPLHSGCGHVAGTVGWSVYDMVLLGALFLDQEFRFMGCVERDGRRIVELAFHEEERGKDLFLSPGGSAANTAIQAARLGLRAGILGKVGDDPYSALILQGLAQEGIETGDLLVSKQERTGTTVILSGRRSQEWDLAMVTFGGANETLEPREMEARLEGMSTAERSVFFVGDFFALPRMQSGLAELLSSVRKRGMITALDHGRFRRSQTAERVLRSLEAAMERVDVYLPSEREIREFSGKQDLTEALDLVMGKYGVQVIAVKRGAKGCRVRTAGKDVEIPAFPLQDGQVSALGAGSAFNAAFLWQWRVNSDDLVQAAQAGNAAGRIKVVSGQQPTGKRLTSFLKKQNQKRTGI